MEACGRSRRCAVAVSLRGLLGRSVLPYSSGFLMKLLRTVLFLLILLAYLFFTINWNFIFLFLRESIRRLGILKVRLSTVWWWLTLTKNCHLLLSSIGIFRNFEIFVENGHFVIRLIFISTSPKYIMWYYAKTVNRCNKNVLHYFCYIISHNWWKFLLVRPPTIEGL